MTSLSSLNESAGTLTGPEVDWPAATAPGVTAVTANPRAPLIAAGIAAGICLAIAGLGWVIAPEGWVLGVVGFPGTTFLAWRMGARVATATRAGAAGIALGLTVETILIADALVVVLVVISSSIGSFDSLTVDGGATFLATLFGGAVFGLFMFLIGAVVVGIPVALVVVPAALIWAALVRYFVGRAA
jgi:hypothetical protein